MELLLLVTRRGWGTLKYDYGTPESHLSKFSSKRFDDEEKKYADIRKRSGTDGRKTDKMDPQCDFTTTYAMTHKTVQAQRFVTLAASARKTGRVILNFELMLPTAHCSKKNKIKQDTYDTSHFLNSRFVA